jgi:hypothetical protein
MSESEPTWIVLARDLSDTITVTEQPRVAAALILDAGTGLIRGAAVGDTVRQASAAAARTALTVPAGPLLPQRPATVVYDEAHAEEILAALGDALPDPAAPLLVPGPPPAEADDIFDSLVGHLTGREQPAELPGPQDWACLYAGAAVYCRSQPWQLWSDADRMALTTDVDGERTCYTVIVYGQHGVHRGLAVCPVARRSDRQQRPPAGSLVLWLDPPDEVPGDRLARAHRYGWPEDSELAPIAALVHTQGLGDLDRTAARHLTLALAAVVAHQRPRRSDTTIGTAPLAGDMPGRYTISDTPQADAVRFPSRPAPDALPRQQEIPAMPELPALRPIRTARLRVTLREVAPAVVRVLDVPATSTLPELHDMLQVGIGWTDSHLHEFDAGGERYGQLTDDAWDDELLDETTAGLRDLPARFSYRYDFGDGWKHDIEILGRGGPEPGCVQGEGACPPEDCGGSYGYAELLEALADPTHHEHEHLRVWSSDWSPTWTEADRQDADRLVRATVGRVPASVRLLLDLIGDKVSLTPGGRLPRAFVRAVQEQRPAWGYRGKPASVEEDLAPLADLHHLMRRVGLLRLARGVLTPTKAAADDLEMVRRLRRAFAPGGFDDVLAGVAVAHLAARGAMPRAELAELTHPWLDRWSVNGSPVTPDDVDTRLTTVSDCLEALDLVQVDRRVWHPGPSADTLLPRATALAHIFRRQGRPEDSDRTSAADHDAGRR